MKSSGSPEEVVESVLATEMPSEMAYCALAEEDVPALKALEGMTAWSLEAPMDV